ncbi:PREDICTED: transcriptional adapter 3-B-like [Rhagoletis zephyria]|uniref:transcriptional adapter 3-B-like n=1 Tax=Rhagoletis zephyria TaxID=28612 RepID=UPI0008116E93|nr:PREDICTED: transcriptional adapter 3-B-like [Rhagoletis zephyria]
MATSNAKSLKASTFGASSSGGGNRTGGKTGPVSTTSQPDADSVTSTINIPLIKIKDSSKQLPTYHAALQRSAEDYLAAEDLDNIQLELETLLSSVALRYRVLKSEYESLDKDERRIERRSKHGASGADTPIANAGASSSGKRKRDETSSVRKPKHTPASSLKYSKHAKNSPVAPNTDDSLDYVPPSGSHGHGQNRDHHLQKVTLPKNDTPNKFWLSVEPYCMPLTNEDLRLLDDLLEQYSGPLVPPIPELGPHYSSIWAAEDLKEVQQASNPNANSNRLKPQNSASNAMIKKAESIMDECVTGPLTQRLVSALLEEQLIQNPSELSAAAVADSSNSSSENTHSSAQMNFRSLSLLRNCIDIEKRVKKELIEQGILDLNDFPNNDEDEIHAEIKRLIAELSAIAEYNGAALKRLHESAAEEIKRLEIKRKLDTIDQEILEAYKRTMQNKAKRKPLSTEDQQEIYRLTSEQKALSDQLERIQANCFLYE